MMREGCLVKKFALAACVCWLVACATPGELGESEVTDQAGQELTLDPGEGIAFDGAFVGGIAADGAPKGFTFGRGSSAGRGAVAIGHATTAPGTYAVSVGAYNRSSGAGSVVVGENSQATGDNANVIGYSSIASGYVSNVIGSYSTARGMGSISLGLQATTSRVGELGHSSGTPHSQGLNAIDLFTELPANGSSTGVLKLRDQTELRMDTQQLVSMRVRLMAATPGGAAKVASEVHELLLNVKAGVKVTIVKDITVAELQSFASQGWAVDIQAGGPVPTGVLRFACDAGDDPKVRFFARVEWSRIGNL